MDTNEATQHGIDNELIELQAMQEAERIVNIESDAILGVIGAAEIPNVVAVDVETYFHAYTGKERTVQRADNRRYIIYETITMIIGVAGIWGTFKLGQYAEQSDFSFKDTLFLLSMVAGTLFIFLACGAALCLAESIVTATKTKTVTTTTLCSLRALEASIAATNASNKFCDTSPQTATALTKVADIYAKLAWVGDTTTTNKERHEAGYEGLLMLNDSTTECLAVIEECDRTLHTISTASKETTKIIKGLGSVAELLLVGETVNQQKLFAATKHMVNEADQLLTVTNRH